MEISNHRRSHREGCHKPTVVFDRGRPFLKFAIPQHVSHSSYQIHEVMAFMMATLQTRRIDIGIVIISSVIWPILVTFYNDPLQPKDPCYCQPTFVRNS